MNLIISSNLPCCRVLQVNLSPLQAGQEFVLILTQNLQINLIESSKPRQSPLDNYFSKIPNLGLNNFLEDPLLRLKIMGKRKKQIFARKTGKTTVLNQQTKSKQFFQICSPLKLSLSLNDGRQVQINLEIQKKGQGFREQNSLFKSAKSNKIIEETQTVPSLKIESNFTNKTNQYMFQNDRFLSPSKMKNSNEILLEEFCTPVNKKQDSGVKFGTGSTKLPPFTSSRSNKSNTIPDQAKISTFFPTPRMPSLENKEIFGTPKNSRKGILPKSCDRKFTRSKKKINEKSLPNSGNDFSDVTYIICFSNLSKQYL